MIEKKKFVIPNIPQAPSIPSIPTAKHDDNEKKIDELYEYSTKAFQIGMPVPDASKFINYKCNEMALTGWRFIQSIQVNISEAVLIFERKIRS
jgi:hypothetical protein